MKSLSITSKVLLAFTLPLALGYYFLVLPQIRATSQAFADVDSLRQSTTPLATAKQRDSYKAKLDAVRTDALTLMPSSDNQFDLSVQVEALAKSKNLTITALGVNAALPTNLPATTAAVGGAGAAGGSPITALKVTVTVGVQGQYSDIQQFLAGLTTLDRFIQVDTAAISVSAGTQVTASVTAFAYYQPAAH